MLYHERVVDHSPHERALRFTLEHTIIFRSGHVRTHNLSTGATDWERVTRLQITAIKGAAMSDLPFRPDWFSKPGDTLAALMAQREISVRQLAENLAQLSARYAASWTAKSI